jgi:hypothetical protein
MTNRYLILQVQFVSTKNESLFLKIQELAN